MTNIMVSCFDVSTIMAQPWAESGYKCYCVDTQHPPGETVDGNIIRVGADVMDWLPPREPVAFAAFFPPCTHVAVSGARWFKDKGLGKLIEALQLFEASVRLAEWLGCPYLIENPVSTVSSYWRQPDHSFNPCDYGEDYTKKTCLWVGGGFRMPKKNRVEATAGSKLHLLPPSDDRAYIRSLTSVRFARAVFWENSLDGKFDRFEECECRKEWLVKPYGMAGPTECSHCRRKHDTHSPPCHCQGCEDMRAEKRSEEGSL